jgi:hypothetical protein
MADATTPRVPSASRDDFAVAALSGILSSLKIDDFHANLPIGFTRIAELAYQFADAMLKARGA